MKLKVQAQHLQPGDIIGSGEVVKNVTIASINWSSSKVSVHLDKDGTDRYGLWGKYTMINVERKTLEEKYKGGLTDEDLDVDGFGP